MSKGWQNFGHRKTAGCRKLSVALTLFFVPVRFRTLSESETTVSESETAVSAAETTVSTTETLAETNASAAETTVSANECFGRRNDPFRCRNDNFPATELNGRFRSFVPIRGTLRHLSCP